MQAIQQPNTACTRLGVRTAFFGIFLACADSCFEGDSPSHPKRVTRAVGHLNFDFGISVSIGKEIV